MLELDIIKQQVRLDLDFDADDTLLDTYAGAAKRYVERYTDRKLYATTSEAGYADDPDALLLDDDITVAMLLLIGHWYANRESVVTGTITAELPMAVHSFLWPHRRLGV